MHDAFDAFASDIKVWPYLPPIDRSGATNGGKNGRGPTLLGHIAPWPRLDALPSRPGSIRG